MNRPIGILGGSFDPVHNAHLRLAHAALETLELASLRWLPNSHPGHREKPRAGATARLAMLRLAIAPEPRFSIDESELWREQPTFTVETLERLRADIGMQIPLVFVIGADQLLGLHTWKRWRELFALTHFAIAERPGYELQPAMMNAAVAAEFKVREAAPRALIGNAAGAMTRFPCPPLDVSSSAIRESLMAGKSVADLLPGKVLAYIESNRLYQPTQEKEPR